MTEHELILEIHRRIDKFALERVHETFAGSTFEKFFDVDAFAYAAALHALRLNEELKPGSRCLDLGCGFGYVALALECLGHTCVGWDNTAQILRNVAIAIPIKTRIFQTIRRCGIGNDFPKDFDLIFLHGVFPMRDENGWWKRDDYIQLGKTLIDSLNPDGRLEILVNRGDQEPECLDLGRWKAVCDPDTLVVINDNHLIARKNSLVLSENK